MNTDPTYIANLKNLVESGARPDLAPTLASLQAQSLVTPSVEQSQGGTISVSTLTPQVAVKLPPPPPPGPDTAGAMVAASEASTKAYNDAKAVSDAKNTEYSTLSNEVYDLLPELKNKSAYQSEAETAQNLPALNTELADVDAQILSDIAEYNALEASYTDLSTKNRGEVMTMNRIIGNEAQINYSRLATLGRKASDIGLLQARSLGLQGKVTAAQKTADRAVDLKYSAIEDTINVKMKQLEILAPILSKEETETANARAEMLADQKAQIAETKQATKDNINLALQAGITTRFYSYAGEVRNTLTGEGYATPEEFFRAAGVTSWEQAAPLITRYEDQINAPEWSDPYSLGGDLVQRNLKTGEIRTAVNVTGGGGGETKTDFNTAATNLQNQRIPSTALNKDTSLSVNYRKKLLDSGLTDELITWMWEAVIDGNSFDDIRNEIRKNNVDPVILDTFIQTLQE